MLEALEEFREPQKDFNLTSHSYQLLKRTLANDTKKVPPNQYV